MPIGDFFKSLFSGGLSELGGKVKDIIDESKFSAEEKAELSAKVSAELNDHITKMAALAQAEVDSYLKDTQDARDANARIQESDKASWMAKNIAYCLDITLIVAFITMLLIIVYRVVPGNNKELFYTSFGLLGGYVSTVINFHRGTSSGSKASGDTLRNILKQK